MSSFQQASPDRGVMRGKPHLRSRLKTLPIFEELTNKRTILGVEDSDPVFHRPELKGSIKDRALTIGSRV
jgi:hypothetical protein